MGRRGLLAAFGASAAALTLSACGPDTATPSDPTSHAVATDALGPLYSETLGLISTFDAALVAHPELAGLLGPLREDHRQHAVALASLLRIPAPALSAVPSAGPSTGPNTPAAPSSASSSPAPGSSSAKASGASGASAAARTALAPLAAVEKTAHTNAVTACLSAPADRAAILASIAACRATHLVVLS